MKGRRLICPGLRKIEVENFEIEPIAANGVLVRNEFTTVSVGTELWNWINGSEPGDPPPTFPRLTGYCNAGTVLEVGNKVTQIKPGDRVAGQGNHASHSILTKLITKIPKNVSSKSASLLTMAAIAMHGVRVAKVELGEAVIVIGLGLVGQFALSLAKLNGALPVIGIDLNYMRIKKAKNRGADTCINPEKVNDIVNAVRKICIEDGANCVIEATGIPAVYPMAVKLACEAGRLIALGSPRGTVKFNFMEEVHLREVSILGAIHPKTPVEGNIYYWWTKSRERNLIFRLMNEGKLNAEDLITHVAKPDECLKIYNMLADNPREALGVVFNWK